MKCYTIAALLLLALTYTATCAPNDDYFEIEMPEEPTDSELALEVLGSFDDEDSLNALDLSFLQLESLEEEARFRGLAKLLKIGLKSFARVLKKVLPKAAKAGKSLAKSFADENAIRQQNQ
uniref:Oxy 1e n=1 Tax=Oxyopes lineatus TaxID=366495 RepID=A0A8D7ZRS0_OXYLI|nr:Oxy 1e precursor [Oxyopes lineatus]